MNADLVLIVGLTVLVLLLIGAWRWDDFKDER